LWKSGVCVVGEGGVVCVLCVVCVLLVHSHMLLVHSRVLLYVWVIFWWSSLF
jgi:hypothetical protein